MNKEKWVKISDLRSVLPPALWGKRKGGPGRVTAHSSALVRGKRTPVHHPVSVNSGFKGHLPAYLASSGALVGLEDAKGFARRRGQVAY